LLTLGKEFGEHNESGQLAFDFHRLDLAQPAGIPIENAIRAVSHFEQRGWVNSHYHTITPVDPDELASLATSLGADTFENIL
jgi:hypothetical protein